MLFRKKAKPSHLVSEKYDTVVWLVQNLNRRQYNQFKTAMDSVYEGCIAMKKVNDHGVDEITKIEQELEKEV